MNFIRSIGNLLCLHEFRPVSSYRCWKVCWQHWIASISVLDRCQGKFVGQCWRCPNYHAIVANSRPFLSCLHKNGVDGTVARHITQTSPPNARESTGLIILFWISIYRSHENVSLCKLKRKGGTLTTRTGCTPDSPARTPLTRRETRCLAISLICGMQLNKPSIAKI
mgnify:CR=1 FL=1